MNHRKIYEQHYGTIPKDKDGRTYEIHHIDGNHSNNSPSNLKAVTIQEHYDIHLSQRDYGACLRISERMNLNSEEIGELSSNLQKQRVEKGTHPFQTRPDGTNISADRVANRTHNMLKRADGTSYAADRVENGTHPWQTRLDGTSLSLDRVAAGTNPFLSGEIQRKSNQERVKNKTHHLLKENRKKVSCPYCSKTGDERLMKRYHFENCKFKNKMEMI